MTARTGKHAEPKRSEILADLRTCLEVPLYGVHSWEIGFLLDEIALLQAELAAVTGPSWRGDGEIWSELSVRAQHLLLDHGIDSTEKLIALNAEEAVSWPCGGRGLANQLRSVQDFARHLKR